jgi:hypothetical protein
MPSRSNLIPTPVTDKNGKATTVYRKPQSSRGAKVLPPPAPSPEAALAAAVQDAYIRLSASNDTIARLPGNTLSNLRALARESTEILGELVRHIGAAEYDEAECWAKMLTRGNHDPSHHYYGSSVSLEGGEFYRRHMAVKGMAVRLASRSKRYAAYELADTCISNAVMFCGGDYGKDYSRLRAGIIVATMAVLKEDDEYGFFPRGPLDRGDIEYIAENIDAVEKVIDLVLARGTTDREVLKEMITSHSTLAEGSL